MPLEMPLILKESSEIIALEDIVSSYTKQNATVAHLFVLINWSRPL